MSLAVLLATLACTTDPYTTVIKHTRFIGDSGSASQITNCTRKSFPTLSSIKIHLLSSKQAMGDTRDIGDTVSGTRIPWRWAQSDTAVINNDGRDISDISAFCHYRARLPKFFPICRLRRYCSRLPPNLVFFIQHLREIIQQLHTENQLPFSPK